MIELPFHLCCELNRRQRLLPHLKIWGALVPFTVIGLIVLLMSMTRFWWLPGLAATDAEPTVGVLTRMTGFWWLYGLAALCLGWLFRGMFIGFLDVVVHRVVSMELLIEDNAMRLGDNGWLFLDGFTSMQELTRGVWTLQHWHGYVVNIPTTAIADDQVEHLKLAIERGRRPEEIQKVIERGRLIQRLEEEQRRRRE
jgi:hypothetical protein